MGCVLAPLLCSSDPPWGEHGLGLAGSKRRYRTVEQTQAQSLKASPGWPAAWNPSNQPTYRPVRENACCCKPLGFGVVVIQRCFGNCWLIHISSHLILTTSYEVGDVTIHFTKRETIYWVRAIFAKMCSNGSWPASRLCSLYSHIEHHTEKSSALGLIFCCWLLQILNNSIFELGFCTWSRREWRAQMSAKEICTKWVYIPLLATSLAHSIPDAPRA